MLFRLIDKNYETFFTDSAFIIIGLVCVIWFGGRWMLSFSIRVKHPLSEIKILDVWRKGERWVVPFTKDGVYAQKTSLLQLKP